jgi:NADPH:quinone reductase-like Zn-dependent oxidoreductase
MQSIRRLEERMKRWVLKAGARDSNELVLEDVPLPEPGRDEVRVRVDAASLNYRDQLVLKDTSGRLRITHRMERASGPFSHRPGQ